MTTNAEWMLKQGMKFSDLTWGYIKGKCIVYYKAGERFDELYSKKSVNPENLITKWLDMEHVEPILDDTEKRYLAAIIKPFRDRVNWITKVYEGYKKYYIQFSISDIGFDDYARLPYFYGNEMYKGMEPNKKYTLEDLGL